MVLLRRRVASLIPVAISAALIVGATSFTSADDGPRKAAQHFLAEFAKRDVDAAATRTDNPGKRAQALGA